MTARALCAASIRQPKLRLHKPSLRTMPLARSWARRGARPTDETRTRSDAWDHSIKAIEHILKPVVCPSNAKVTLGDIVGDLRSQANLWKLALPGKDGDFSVNRLVSMLNLIWPNPDRHGCGSRRRSLSTRLKRSSISP